MNNTMTNGFKRSNSVVLKTRSRSSSNEVIRLKSSSPFKITLPKSQQSQTTARHFAPCPEYSEVFREVTHSPPQVRRQSPKSKKLINNIYKSPLKSTKLESYSKVIHSFKAKHENSVVEANLRGSKAMEKFSQTLRLREKFPNFFMNTSKAIDTGHANGNILKDLEDNYVKSSKDLWIGPFHLKSYSVSNLRQSPIQQKSERLNESRLERRSQEKPQDYMYRRETNIQEYQPGISRESTSRSISTRPTSGIGLGLQVSIVKLNATKEGQLTMKVKRATSAAAKVNRIINNIPIPQEPSYLKKSIRTGAIHPTDSSQITSIRIPTDHSKDEPLFQNMMLQQLNQTQTHRINIQESNSGNKKMNRFICSWSQITGRKEALKKFPIKLKEESVSFRQISMTIDNETSK